MKFKIASTSYIYPGDILFNVDKLKDKVDGIQLIFFESPENSNLPNPVDIDALNRIANEHDLKYFIHLPIDIDLSTGNKLKKEKNLNSIKKIIKIGERLDCKFYIAHLISPACTGKDHAISIKNIEQSLNTLFKHIPVKDKFLIENADHRVKVLDHFLFEYGLGLCLDIGHLALQQSLISTIHYYKEKIKLIHIHGIDENKKDHKSLKYYKTHELKTILTALTQTETEFLIIEVFDEESLSESNKLLNSN